MYSQLRLDNNKKSKTDIVLGGWTVQFSIKKITLFLLGQQRAIVGQTFSVGVKGGLLGAGR